MKGEGMMDLKNIHVLTNKMWDIVNLEKQKKQELDIAFQELSQVQNKIASLEQDLANLKKEYQALDNELRPGLATYLKENNQEELQKEIVF